MKPHEIQTVCLTALDSVGVTILRSELYSLSNEPDEPGHKSIAVPAFLFTAIMSKSEYFVAKEMARGMGVHFKGHWLPYGFTGQFIYEVLATEEWR